MSSQSRVDEFIRLFTSHEPRLRAYVLTLIPRWSDAEEVMQQCNLVLWQKFPQYHSGTNFFAWACRIARLEVMDFRKRQGRERALFSDEFVDVVAEETSAMSGELSDRLAAMQACIEKLPADHRRMLLLRYTGSGSVEQVAATLQRTVEAVYKALSRIRHTLHDCVTRSLAVGKA